MDVRIKVREASPKLLNAWLLFVTTAILAIVFVFYQFVYVKNNEKAQVDKRFRVLSRIGKNISDREKALRKVAKNAIEEGLVESMTDLSGGGWQTIANAIRSANNVLKVEEKTNVRKNYISFLTLNPATEFGMGENKTYVVYTEAADFFDPLKRPATFDELIVINTVQQQDEEKGGTVAGVFYHTFPGDIDIRDIGTLRDENSTIEAGSLKDIGISNRDYKLFLQPILLENAGKWYVGGLVERSRFNGEIRILKSDFIILFLIAFFTFILAIPLLKLFLMSTFDQLHINDVILASVSITLGMLLMLLFYLFFYQKAGDKASVENHLKSLAQQVEKEFTSELERAYRQLQTYDEMKPGEYGLVYSDQVNNLLSSNHLTLYRAPEKKGNKDLQQLVPSIYKLFKLVFWMDTEGNQQLEFSTRNHSGSLVNVGHRSYFKQAGNWRLPGDRESHFMLESITSITSGEKIAALSMKSGLKLNGSSQRLEAAAMTARLTSVIDTIMPAGYGFCIIDRSGDTWFHSDKERIKEENFIDETGRESELLSAIEAAQSHYMILGYQNKSHKCYILPLPGIPLFIVTFHDLQYTRSIHAHTVFYAVIFTILVLLLNGLLFLAAAFCPYRTSSIRRRFIPFDRLRPDLGKEKIYEHLIYANLLAIFFLAVSRLWAGQAETLFICLSAALFIFSYNYYTASKEITKRNTPFIKWGGLTLVIFLLFINVAAFLLADSFIRVLLFQVLLAIGLVLLNRYKFKEDKKKETSRQDIKGLEKRYAGFLLSWLAAVCAVPLILFYIDAYNVENETALKYLQVNLAGDIEKRNIAIDSFYKEKMTDPRQSENIEDTRGARRREGIYTGIICDTHRTEKRPHPPFTALRRFDRAAYLFRPPFNGLDIEKRDLVFSRSADYSRVWWKEKDKLYLRKEIENSLPDSPDRDKIYIASDMKYFPMPTGASLVFAPAAALLILWLTYSLIRYTGRRVFGLNIMEVAEPRDFLLQIREAVQTGAHVAIYCRTRERAEYIHNLGKNKFMPKKAPHGDTGDLYVPVEVELFDLIEDKENIEKITTGKSKRLLVKNFDLNEYDLEGNRDKLKTLSTLLRIRGVQVLVTSPVPLPRVVEWYEMKKAATDEMKADFAEISCLLTEAYEQMLPIYAPLKDEIQSTDGVVPATPYKTIDEEIADPHIKEVILNEFASSVYFKNIEECVALYYGRLMTKRKKDRYDDIGEKIIQKIRELSKQHYDQLLRSCTRQELLVLHDIARDTLINVNNMETIEILLKKGLLVYDGTFRLMNESFRSHILLSMDTSTADRLMQEIKTHSKWKSYKAPFFIILLGLAVFLAFQGNLLSEINALMTAVIGTLAIVSKFSGLLTKGGAGPAS